MSDRDTLQRFIIEEKDIRGELVHLRDSITAATEHIDYPASVKKLLGEALCAATLLSATLKFEGRLSLQLQGDGPIKLLLAQVNHERRLKGVIKHEVSNGDASFKEMVGNAKFAITIDPDKGKKYQGIVPLEGSSLAECLEGYFLQSEQLPTQIWLASDIENAAGFMIQKLPGHTEEIKPEDWEHISILAKSITDEELLTLDNQTILYRLFHQEQVRVFEEQPVHFKCDCSKERCENAIVSLGKKEIDLMVEEGKPLEMGCDFCGAQYQIELSDLKRLSHSAN